MNNTTKDIVKTISSIMPQEAIDKYGWVVLAVPLAFYTIDKVNNLILTAMENGYSLNIHSEKLQISLNNSTVINE